MTPDADIYAIRESHPTMAQIDASRYERVVGRGGVRLTARDREAKICRIHPGTRYLHQDGRITVPGTR